MSMHRLAQLRSSMSPRGVDAVLISAPHLAAAFFDGAQMFNGTRPEPPGRAGILVTSDALHVLGSHTEATRIANEELQGFEGVRCQGRPWHHWDLECATSELAKELGLGVVWTDSFGPDREPCRELLGGLLYPLSLPELERLRWLGQRIAEVLVEAARGLEQGVTEQAVAARLHQRLLESGALPDLIFVSFDERTARYRHCKPGPARLKNTALLSVTASHRGLFASATRLVALGSAPKELIRQTRAANAIEAAAVRAVLDGEGGAGVFEAMRQEYREQGHPGGWEEHHLGGPSGFSGRDAKVGPGREIPFVPGAPFVFNPVVGAGKSEDTFFLGQDGQLECLTRETVWPARPVEVGALTLNRPGVLELNPLPPEAGVVGVGRMGGGAARRLCRQGVRVVAADPQLSQLEGCQLVGSLAALRDQLGDPARVLLFVPQSAVDQILFGEGGLATVCSAGDVIVDAGNSSSEDSLRRAERLASYGIGFVDAGVSGGLEGARMGYCVACGGQPEHYQEVAPLLRAMAARGACAHVGPPGAGHFLKTVHNGVEYGMLQAVAEGVATVEHNAMGLPVTAADFTRVWRRGSIIESRILGWFHEATRLSTDGVAPVVGGGETGRWALDAAREAGVPAPVLEAALGVRASTPTGGELSAKLLALVRKLFGGHPVVTAPEDHH